MDAEISVNNSVPELLPVGRNGGSLLSGGMPGNAGGSGRPSSELRAMCADLGYSAIPKIRERMDSVGSDALSVSDLLRAADLGCKYNLPMQTTVLVSDASQIAAVIEDWTELCLSDPEADREVFLRHADHLRDALARRG